MKLAIGLIFAVCVLCIANGVHAEGRQLIITEVMYDAEGSDTDKEWIEVVNSGDESIVIFEGTSDAALRVFDGSSHLLSLVQGTTTVASGQAVIFADDGAAWLLDHPDYKGTLFDTVLSLNNTGEEIGLQYGSAGELFSIVQYSSDNGGAGNGHTLERIEGDALDVVLWQESGVIGGSPGIWPHSVNPSNTNQEDTSSIPENTVTQEPTVPDWSYDFHITELIPNPVGSDDAEWIEVYNASPFTIDTTDWWITDASGKKYTFSEIEISPFSYFVVERTVSNLALNNTGDELYLYTADGSLRETITYTGGTEGQSWAWFREGWEWTDRLTPGASNIKMVESDHDDTTGPVVSSNLVESIELPPEDTIFVTELLPNPEGPDVHEWVEIFNAGSDDFDLSGWMMTDSSKKKPFSFPQGTLLRAQQFLVFERGATRITLNNGSDSVRLLTPAGDEWFKLEYDGAKSGLSFSLDTSTEEYVWTEQHTPGAAYVHKGDTEDDPEILGEELVVPYTYSELFDLPKKSRVMITGIVMLPPGVAGKQKMYIAEDVAVLDRSLMLEIYQHQSNFPDVRLGDAVTVTGELRIVGDTVRIAIETEDQVEIQGSGLHLDVQEIPMALLTQDILATVSGTIEKINSTSIRLNNEDDSMLVYFIGEHALVLDTLEKGYRVSISGYVKKRGVSLVMVAFDERYIAIDEANHVDDIGENDSNNHDIEVITLPQNTEAQSSQLWYFGTVPLAAGIGWAFKRFIAPRLW